MNKYILDTDILIYFLKGDEHIAQTENWHVFFTRRKTILSIDAEIFIVNRRGMLSYPTLIFVSPASCSWLAYCCNLLFEGRGWEKIKLAI